MAKAESSERKRGEKLDTDALKTRIAERVLRVLGKPDTLQSVQVRPLWGEHYRVNILVGADGISGRVAHSFFLVVDAEGTILTSTPEISRCY